MVKTGRLLISHEAPVTGGFAAEISTTVQVKTKHTYSVNVLFAREFDSVLKKLEDFLQSSIWSDCLELIASQIIISQKHTMELLIISGINPFSLPALFSYTG